MIEILIAVLLLHGDLYDDLYDVADRRLYRQFSDQGVDGIRRHHRHDQGQERCAMLYLSRPLWRLAVLRQLQWPYRIKL